MKTIHLILRYRWFDMIASGEKIEDYREIKPYYKRLCDLGKGDIVIFHRGYSSRVLIVNVTYCYQSSYGLREWGWERDEPHWVIGIEVLGGLYSEAYY